MSTNGAKPAKETLADWMTKQETAALLKVSTKSVEKFASDGKLQSARRSQTGRPDLVVYHPGDVERLRGERQPEPEAFVVPTTSEALQKTSPTSRMMPANGAALAFVEGFRELFQKASPMPRLFVSLKEAADYAGLPQTLLRKWIDEKKLEALKTGRGWRIRRKDLENL